MGALTIGKLAAAAEVGVETVRYYQRIGLLSEPEKAGAVRHYGEEHLERLRFIRRAKDAGFTLEEIRELLGLDEVSERAKIRALATQRLDAIRARIADMQLLAGDLEQLIERCEHSSAEQCCPIIQTFS